MADVLSVYDQLPGDENDKEKLIEEIYDELYQSAALEYCFDIHRACKLNYLHWDPGLWPYGRSKSGKSKEIEEKDTTKTVQKKKEVIGQSILTCPKCGDKAGADFYAKHLAKCLYGIGERATSTRAPTTRATRSKAVSSTTPVEKPTGKTQGQKSKAPKKTQAQKAKTSDEKEASAPKNCVAILKTGKRCKNSINCPKHKKENQAYLRSLTEQATISTAVDPDKENP